MKKEIRVSITEDDDLPAFAGFVAGSTKNEVRIKVNIPVTLLVCAEHDIDFYELLAESTVHEMLHAFQELYKKAFDEEEVEEALLQARKNIKKSVDNNCKPCNT